MAAPRWLARFNRHVTNRVLGAVATRVPWFGVIVHTGRRSGRSYRTPVNVFPTTGGYVVALTYGPASDWVQNVLAAGGCELETQGRRVVLGAPRLVHDASQSDVPRLVRAPLRLLGVADFLLLSAEKPTSGRARAADG